MVRDNLKREVVHNEKQTCAAETQSLSQVDEGATGSEQRAQSPDRAKPESPELLLWCKLHLEEPRSWDQPRGVHSGNPSRLYLTVAANAESFPTHLRPFSSRAQYKLVKHTFLQLQHSGYYWGSMTMEEAHEILEHTPLGTFIIRDSGQPDVFFTLSYQSDTGPTSVRVQLNNLLFSLYGSHRTFSSLFTLLTYYTSSSCKLTTPYRKQRPEFLKQMCRRSVIRTYGAENISTLAGLSNQIKDYVHAYHYCI